MGSPGVVVDAPFLDDLLGFLKAVEDLAIEQLVSQLAIEGFAISVLPRRSGLDVKALAAQSRQPLPQHLRNHLRTIVRPDVGGDALKQHDVGQGLDNVNGIDPAGDVDGQALARELVDQRHQPQAPAVIGSSFDKVEAPDMVGIRRPKPDAGSVIEPKPASLWLLLRHLQPLAAPDALNPILANLNAACVQQGRHPAIAVTPILRGKEDDIPRQLIFIGLERGNIALCSPWLPDDPAG